MLQELLSSDWWLASSPVVEQHVRDDHALSRRGGGVGGALLQDMFRSHWWHASGEDRPQFVLDGYALQR